MSELAPDRTTIDTLRADFRVRLAAAGTDAAVKALADEFLSRKSGSVTGLMKTLGALAPDARREFGALVNSLKQEIEAAVEERRQTLAATRPPAGAVDVTLPSRERPVGHVHPLMQVRQQVEDIFAHMGYEILEGPEVEDDFHNFEALNMPPDHPARDMQDTLYLERPIIGGTWGAHRGHRCPEAQVRRATLLRTHTSAMQIRYMKTFPPPVRIIVPGRVYRRDNLDLTHTPNFQQFEGLVVGEHVTMADLKGTLTAMVTALFGDVKIRLRPSFFPVHRAERRGRHQLPQVRGSGLRDLQANWLVGDSRERHGASGRLRSRGLRPRPRHRLRVRDGDRAGGDAQVRRRGHPTVLRERPAIPRAVPVVMKSPPLLAP